MNDCSYAEKGYPTRILSETGRGLADFAGQKDRAVFECQILTRENPVKEFAEDSWPSFVVLRKAPLVLPGFKEGRFRERQRVGVNVVGFRQERLARSDVFDNEGCRIFGK